MRRMPQPRLLPPRRQQRRNLLPPRSPQLPRNPRRRRLTRPLPSNGFPPPGAVGDSRSYRPVAAHIPGNSNIDGFKRSPGFAGTPFFVRVLFWFTLHALISASFCFLLLFLLRAFPGPDISPGCAAPHPFSSLLRPFASFPAFALFPSQPVPEPLQQKLMILQPPRARFLQENRLFYSTEWFIGRLNVKH